MENNFRRTTEEIINGQNEHVANLNYNIDQQKKTIKYTKEHFKRMSTEIIDGQGEHVKKNDDIYQQKRYTNNMEENFKRTSAEIINGQIEMWQFTTKLEKQLREIQDRLNIRQDFSMIKMAKRIISQGINLVFHSLLGPLYGLLSSGVQTYLLDYHDGDY
ncbi:unnamed protein product [Mytilus edulis]|uniref:Uncharacterized protein n=1 Tax=Mytilus edulis TaxID=6550 RepID=A0A8S3UQI0_MYTED|nr:unnamed protein product [Mytilus edulis]